MNSQSPIYSLKFTITWIFDSSISFITGDQRDRNLFILDNVNPYIWDEELKSREI